MLIKNIPEGLHRRLKERAASHRRSLNSEVLVLLEEATRDRAGPPPLEEVDRLRVTGTRPLTRELLDEARHTGRP